MFFLVLQAMAYKYNINGTCHTMCLMQLKKLSTM